MEFVTALERLSNACGVTGREDEVRRLLTDLLTPHVDEVREDRLGNVIGVRRGRRDGPTVMVAAHMDEIGLMVKHVTTEGFLQFAKIGGIDDRILVAQKVRVHTATGPRIGVIGSKPPHLLKEEERKKVLEADALFIDVGASSAQEVTAMGVRVGDPISFDVAFARLGDTIVVGKALDDRVGCAALAAAVERLDDIDGTLYAVGTIQEEVGLRGATTAAFGLAPDVGLALDATVAGGVPGMTEVETAIKLGRGPAITVADRGLITHPTILRHLIDAAERNGIPYQLETGLPGSTDAARIALTREGVPSGVISIPTRYIHSPVSLLSLEDAENAVKLACAAVASLARGG